jgi:hypothetical protein
MLLCSCYVGSYVPHALPTMYIHVTCWVHTGREEIGELLVIPGSSVAFSVANVSLLSVRIGSFTLSEYVAI